MLPIETSIHGDRFWIKWQDYLQDTDTHTFILKYRAVGAIANSFGTDTLNWKAIFPKRKASINNSKITINLPKSLVGKVRNYYSIGGNFKNSLVNDTTIKFTSLQSLLPKQSVVIKVIFSGNYLHLPRHNSSVVNPEISLTFKNIFGYIIVGLVCLISLAIIAISLFIFFLTITSRLSKNSSRRNGGCNTGSGCGGCSGGCSGGGCGGGCGGGG